MIGLGILGLISMLIFTGLIARFGAIAALIIIFGIFMLIAYRSDKKKQREWDELDAKADGSSGLAAAAAEPELVEAVGDEALQPTLFPRVDEVGVGRVDAAGAQHDGALDLRVAEDQLDRGKRDRMARRAAPLDRVRRRASGGRRCRGSGRPSTRES